jgi:hypothetical protein
MSHEPKEPDPRQFQRRLVLLSAVAAVGMLLLTARMAWLHWVHG